MRLALLPLVVLATGPLTPLLAPPAFASGLPVCNAKHKRPANPYGSVLAEGLKPAAAVDGAEPPSSVKPQRVSRADWRASLKPCGSRRA